MKYLLFTYINKMLRYFISSCYIIDYNRTVFFAPKISLKKYNRYFFT